MSSNNSGIVFTVEDEAGNATTRPTSGTTISAQLESLTPVSDDERGRAASASDSELDESTIRRESIIGSIVSAPTSDDDDEDQMRVGTPLAEDVRGSDGASKSAADDFNLTSSLAVSGGLGPPATSGRARARTQVFESAPVRKSANQPARPEMSGFDTIRSSILKLQLSTSGLRKKMQDKKASTLTRKDTNFQAMLADELEESYKALQQKDEDLKLAAELGSTLLEKVDESQAYISALEQRIDEGSSKRKMLKDEKNQLKAELRRMASDFEDLKQSNALVLEQNSKLQKSQTNAAGVQAKARNDAEKEKQGEVDGLKLRIQELEKERGELQDAHFELQGELDRARRELVAKEADVQELSRSQAQVAAAATTPAPESAMSTADMMSMMATGGEEWAQLTSELKEAEDASERLRQEKKSLQQELSRVAGNLESSKAECLRLRNTVEVMSMQAIPSPLDVKYKDSVDTQDDYDAVGVSIPQVALASRAVSAAVALGIVVLAGVSLGGSPDVNEFYALVTIFWNLLWLLFEVRLVSMELTWQNYTPFMYSISGRSFHGAMALLFPLGMGTGGLVFGVLAFIATAFQLIVMQMYPELKVQYRLRAKADALGGRRVSAPSLARPLLDDEEP